MIDDCDEDTLCHLDGDLNAPVTRGELNYALKVIRRVYLLPIRNATTALDATINDPKHGLETLRWWIYRLAWGAISLGAGLMAVGHFVKTMGWL